MPFTAEQKRQQRAAKALVAGKHLKRQKRPPVPGEPLASAKAAPEPQAALEEELKRKALEVEDERARTQALFTLASAPLASFYATWLRPGEEVKLKPHYEHALQIGREDRGTLYRLVRQTRGGLWKLTVAQGRHKGKDLCMDVPAEALMP